MLCCRCCLPVKPSQLSSSSLLLLLDEVAPAASFACYGVSIFTYTKFSIGLHSTHVVYVVCTKVQDLVDNIVLTYNDLNIYAFFLGYMYVIIHY